VPRIAKPVSFERVFEILVKQGFNLSLLISGALAFGLLAVTTHATWFEVSKIGLGLLLTTEGVLLMTDWRGARSLTLARRDRSRAVGGRRSVRRRLERSAGSLALQLLGLAWLAAGALTAALGLQQLA
jgi:hypothetical protein